MQGSCMAYMKGLLKNMKRGSCLGVWGWRSNCKCNEYPCSWQVQQAFHVVSDLKCCDCSRNQG